jgi:hypothetical protein
MKHTSKTVLDQRIEKQRARLKDLDERIGRLMTQRVDTEEKLAASFRLRDQHKTINLATRGGENEVPVEAKVGLDVEVHPGHDRWMMGDRFGHILQLDEPGARVRVHLDLSGGKFWFTPDYVLPAK